MDSSASRSESASFFIVRNISRFSSGFLTAGGMVMRPRMPTPESFFHSESFFCISSGENPNSFSGSVLTCRRIF